MIELWVAVGAFLGATVVAFITYVINRNNMVLKYVTEERKKWRSAIRSQMKCLSKAVDSDMFWQLECHFALILNPSDDEDEAIIRNLQRLQALSASIESRIKNKIEIVRLKRETLERVRLLLKHDWERSKFESGKMTLLPYLTTIYIYGLICSGIIYGILFFATKMSWTFPNQIYESVDWWGIIWGFILSGVALAIAHVMIYLLRRWQKFPRMIGYPKRMIYNRDSNLDESKALISEYNNTDIYRAISKFTQDLSVKKGFHKLDIFSEVKKEYEVLRESIDLSNKSIKGDLLLYLKDQANDTETGPFFSSFAIIISSLALFMSIVTPYMSELVKEGETFERVSFMVFMVFIAVMVIRYISMVGRNYRFVHQNRIYKLFIMLIENK